MAVLIRGNVERIVETEYEKQRLEAMGFKPLADSNDEEAMSLDKMNVNDLRAIAKEKGIEGVDKMKKDELLMALEE